MKKINSWNNTWKSIDWKCSPEKYIERQVDNLIANGADVNAVDEYGYTVLMWAAYEGKAVSNLITAGADLETTDKNGWTALMMASEMGRIESAKELLEAGADINAKNKFGHTALTIAEKNEHPDVVQIIKKRQELILKQLQQKSNTRC